MLHFLNCNGNIHVCSLSCHLFDIIIIMLFGKQLQNEQQDDGHIDLYLSETLFQNH